MTAEFFERRLRGGLRERGGLAYSRLRVLLPVLFTAAFVGGCDPCFGTGACGTTEFSAEGRVVWHMSGENAEDIRVEFVRTGGVPLAEDKLVGFSGPGGIFVLRTRALSQGAVQGTLSFFPPAPYHEYVYSIPVGAETVEHQGDARYLGIWGVGPFHAP